MWIARFRYSFCLAAFTEKPTYDALLDIWNGEGFIMLTFKEAYPYLKKVTFENSPVEV